MTSPRFRRRRSSHQTSVSQVILIIWKGVGLLLLTGACFGGLMMHFHHPHRPPQSSLLAKNSEDVGNPNQSSDIIRRRRRSTEQALEEEEEEEINEEEEESYPGNFLDLWPDDRNTEDYRNYLLNCMPGYKYQDQQRDCRVRLKEEGKNDAVQQQQQQQLLSSGSAMIKRIALVRPPGRFGDIFVQYVQQVVDLALQQQQQQQQQSESESEQQQQPKIELVPTPDVIGSDHGYSMILRLATLPVLLEAADIALCLNETTTDDTTPTGKPILLMNSLKKSTTTDDLLDILRYTIRWHCYINQRTQDTALLTITLDRIIGFPSSTGKKIQQFLGIYSSNPPPPPPPPDSTAAKENNKKDKKKKKFLVNLKKIPLMVIDRINSASSLVSNSIKNEDAETLLQLVERVIKEEVQASSSSSSCRSLNTLVDNSNIARRLQKDRPISY